MGDVQSVSAGTTALEIEFVPSEPHCSKKMHLGVTVGTEGLY